MGQQQGELVQFFQEGVAGDGQGRKQLGHAHGAGMGTVGDRKAVVDEDRGSRAFHQGLGELGVVQFFFLVESDVLWVGGGSMEVDVEVDGEDRVSE